MHLRKGNNNKKEERKKEKRKKAKREKVKRSKYLNKCFDDVPLVEFMYPVFTLRHKILID